jgi:phosphatidylserine/phosphatidylglycerophosphate/cardiolipin synthase-like enzyme
VTRRQRASIATTATALLFGLALFLVANPGTPDSLAERPPEQVAADSARDTDSLSTQSSGPIIRLGSGTTTSGAWYELAFTGPTFPDVPKNDGGGLDEMLTGLVKRAQRTIDLAVYDFDLQNVAQAMADAARRGVRVRTVFDSDTLAKTKDHPIQTALATLRNADIAIVEDGRRAIMHHKFVVVDGEWVLTGSWNFTSGDTYRLNNNAIVIQSRALAANYTAEMDKMSHHQFGGSKAAGTPNPSITLVGAHLENYFCPKDNCAVQVIRWVGAARQQIHFMAFSFTHDGIGDVMLDRSRNGVAVAGVFEKYGSETTASEFTRMKQAGLDVVQDGNPWSMHHKVIILDRHVTIFGSFNFSAAADRVNDENLLIIDDPGLAAAFEAEYDQVRAVALRPPGRS